jgi:hypothetical protein
VYRNISDLSNLERVRDRVPEDKLNSFSFDSDSVSVNVAPVGDLKLQIIEREENKCVKFESVQSPLPFNLWIQVLPVSATESKMKVTVQADIPFMLKGMVASFTYGFPVAEEAFAAAGVKLVTLSDYNAVLEQAAETGYIKQEEIEVLKEWRKSPSTWVNA